VKEGDLDASSSRRHSSDADADDSMDELADSATAQHNALLADAQREVVAMRQRLAWAGLGDTAGNGAEGGDGGEEQAAADAVAAEAAAKQAADSAAAEPSGVLRSKRSATPSDAQRPRESQRWRRNCSRRSRLRRSRARGWPLSRPLPLRCAPTWLRCVRN
jgi:hypothetical protein